MICFLINQIQSENAKLASCIESARVNDICDFDFLRSPEERNFLHRIHCGNKSRHHYSSRLQIVREKKISEK